VFDHFVLITNIIFQLPYILDSIIILEKP